MKTAHLFCLLGIFTMVSCKQHCPDPAPTDPSTLTADSLLTPMSSETSVAELLESDPTSTYPTYPEMFVGEWTHGAWYRHRFLLKPDLSPIPATAVIDSAFVVFKTTDNATSSNAGGQVNNLGENSLFIENVTSSWSKDNVTWNTQPASSATGRISVPATVSSNTVKVKIDIKSLVTGWVATPSTYNGMLLKLQDEATQTYRRVLYASPYHSNSTLHPTLLVYYRK